MGRVRQIVTNLVTNAHLYTDEGGHVTVEVGTEDRSVWLTVSDTGRGMTPADVEHVFERFYRAADSASPGGTGLGLSIVRSLVDLHGGSIDVASEPGRGSTFRVGLPRALAQADQDRVQQALQQRIEKSGQAFFPSTILHGRRALRVNINSYLTETRHVNDLVELLVVEAQQIQKGEF